MTDARRVDDALIVEALQARSPAVRHALLVAAAVVAIWGSLDEYLRDNGITGIAGIDTRALTRHIRDNGAQMAAIGLESFAKSRASFCRSFCSLLSSKLMAMTNLHDARWGAATRRVSWPRYCRPSRTVAIAGSPAARTQRGIGSVVASRSA